MPAIVAARLGRPPAPRRAAPRPDPVPRHHRLPGDRAGRRRVRGLRAAARHQRRGESEAHRRRGRLQLLVLALGDVQQRRHQDPLLRRVGRRRRAEVPRHRQEGVGRRRDLHARRTTRWRSRATTSCRRPQTVNENCVAHNGSLIPIPGRDVMVQRWYQGGVSVFDWTDAAKPGRDRLLRPRPGRLHQDGATAGPGRCTGTTASW